MIQGPIGLIHMIAAVVALVTGAMVFFVRKAGMKHKAIGYVYSAAMIVVVVTAFLIYRLTGSFNILHLAAFVSAAALIAGLLPVTRKKPADAWFDRHVDFMAASYIGLIAALIAESATRALAPILHEAGVRSFGWFWAVVGVVTFAVVAIGFRATERYRPAIERYRPKRDSQQGMDRENTD